jgi:hypothetical protein
MMDRTDSMPMSGNNLNNNLGNGSQQSMSANNRPQFVFANRLPSNSESNCFESSQTVAQQQSGQTSNTSNSNAQQLQQSANQSVVSNNCSQPTYSIPGIVHYLQYEWQRFETQRQQWEV